MVSSYSGAQRFSRSRTGVRQRGGRTEETPVGYDVNVTPTVAGYAVKTLLVEYDEPACQRELLAIYSGYKITVLLLRCLVTSIRRSHVLQELIQEAIRESTSARCHTDLAFHAVMPTFITIKFVIQHSEVLSAAKGRTNE